MNEPVARNLGPYSSAAAPHGQGSSANLADILERVLDKGIVIAGDIKINLLDIELLTIKLRLLVASVDKAKEMGIDWWEHDPSLSSRARDDRRISGTGGRGSLAEENRRLREEVAALRASTSEAEVWDADAWEEDEAEEDIPDEADEASMPNVADEADGADEVVVDEPPPRPRRRPARRDDPEEGVARRPRHSDPEEGAPRRARRARTEEGAGAGDGERPRTRPRRRPGAGDEP